MGSILIKLTAFAVVLLALTAMAGDAKIPQNGDRIYFKHAGSFGVIKCNDGIDRQITLSLQNGTSRMVRIREITVGCGCIELVNSEARRLELGPGQEAELILKLRVAEMRQGLSTYLVSVRDDQGIAGVTPVTYEYRPTLLPAKRELRLAVANDGNGYAAETVIRAVAQLPPAWRDSLIAQASTESLTTELSPLGQDEMLLRVRLNGAQSKRHFAANVAIALRDQGETQLVVPVSGTLDSPISVRPEQYSLMGCAINRLRVKCDSPLRRAVIMSRASAHHPPIFALSRFLKTAPWLGVALLYCLLLPQTEYWTKLFMLPLTSHSCLKS